MSACFEWRHSWGGQGQPAEQPTLPNGAMQGQDHARGILAVFALIGYGDIVGQTELVAPFSR